MEPHPGFVLGLIDEGTHIDHTIRAAYVSGADAQLEKCCEWLPGCGCESYGRELRAAMRPKPPSLKEQALETFEELIHGANNVDVAVIRRALEYLPE